MTAPETTAPAPPEQEPPAEEPVDLLAEEARLRAPLEIPPEPDWRPWSEFDACRTVSEKECDGFVSQWIGIARTRTYDSPWWHERARRVQAVAMAAAPLPPAPESPESGHAGVWSRPEQDGPGPSGQDSDVQGAGAHDRMGAGREQADFSPSPAPGPPAQPTAPVPEPEDDAAAAAVKHAADEALRRAGVKQEDLDALAQPGDGRDATTEMTAIIERPEEHQ